MLLQKQLFATFALLTAAAAILLTAHLPVMLIEGVVTAATLGFIARVRPEMLPQTVRDKL